MSSPVIVVAAFLLLLSLSFAREAPYDSVLFNAKESLASALTHKTLAVQDTHATAALDDASAVLSGKMSVPLYHRNALRGKDVTLEERISEMIKRDAARVSAINARLDLAVHGVEKSSLVPKEVDNGVVNTMSEFESPVVSGIDKGSGEYFSQIGVGVPPKEQLMVLDTGSDVSWIQCQPCSDCYQQADPIYNPALSSSFSGVACNNALCQQLDVSGCSGNGSCMYQVSYGDGSYTVGSLATETLTLGGTAVPNVALGCGHDNEGLFTGSAGILGLGGGGLSLPTQLPHYEGRVFSYCLVNRQSGSSSTLQFGSSAVPKGAIQTPMVHNQRMDTFYYAEFSGLGVGGHMVTIPESVFRIDGSGNGGVIVDSGTAVTRLQKPAYDALRDAFVAGTKNLPSAEGVSLFDTCYDLSNLDSVSIPTVSFHFPQGGSLALPPDNYLVPVDSTGTFCFAFAPTTSGLSIVGNIQQQGIRVSFDRLNNQVGFTPKSC